MKDGLEHIDEIVKQAFEGFESNVDPSVWNNIQSSIGANSTPQVDPSTVGSAVGKSLAVKLIAGAAVVATVVTASYFIPELLEGTSQEIVEPIAVVETIDLASEEIGFPLDEEQSNVFEALQSESTGNSKEITEGAPVLVEKVDETASLPQPAVELKQTKAAVPKPTEKKVKESTVKVAASSETAQSFEKPEPPTAQKLSVKINVDVLQGKAPLTVQFDAIGNGYQYFWDFSDDSEVMNQGSPVHTFMEEGTYRVKLSGLDKEGNYKEDYKTIIVEKDYSSSIQTPLQNIFSPNGDGQNDYVKVRGENIEKIQVVIADNNGQPVYFMNSLEEAWDGKDQYGNALLQGQYYMTVVAIGKDGKRHTAKSVVNLRK